MSSCNVIPTLTRTDEVTSTTLLTITSTIVTTLAPTTETFTITVGGLQVTSTSVIPGQTSTTVFTTLSTLLATNTQVTTLSGTTCFPGPTPTPQSPTTTPILPPPTSAVETSLSTQPDGSVVTTSVTQTITAPSTASQTGNSRSDNNNLAAIVGGSVGGGVGLIVILLLVWFFMKMRRRRSIWDGVYNDDLGTKEDAGRIPNIELLEPELIPQPYPHHSSPTSPTSTTPATPYSNGLSDPNYLGRNPSVAPSADYLGYYHPGYGPPQQHQLYPPPQQQPYGGIAQDGAAIPPFAFSGPYTQHQYPLNDSSIGRAAGQGGYPYHPNSSFPNQYEGFAPFIGPPDGNHMQSSNNNSGSTTPVTSGAAGVVGSGPAMPRRDVKSPAGPGSSPHPSPQRVPVPAIHLDGALYLEQETSADPRAGREPEANPGGGARGEGDRTGEATPWLPAYTET